MAADRSRSRWALLTAIIAFGPTRSQQLFIYSGPAEGSRNVAAAPMRSSAIRARYRSIDIGTKTST